jgi:hypothetical protein
MQYRTRAAKNDSASAYRFYRNAKNLQARRFAPRNEEDNHAGSSYPIADSISIVRCTAGRAIMR